MAVTDLPDIEPAAHGLDLYGRPLPRPIAAPSAPFGPAPSRPARSVRRTMSIDILWPDGSPRRAAFDGRARDIATLDPSAPPRFLAEDRITGELDGRIILSVASEPPRPALRELEGERAGSNLRGAIDRLLGAERRAAAPLYLLLDDLAGASLVCMWCWSIWFPDRYLERVRTEASARAFLDTMEGVCIGFRPGSGALALETTGKAPNASIVPPIPDPRDPAGWHALPARIEDAPQFRRARTIDVWREGDRIHARSIFQDSANRRGTEEREAIHEYRLDASADAATGRLVSLDATPGSLPHAECPAATVNIQTLVGTSMADLRETVLERLKRTAGCTHLNDMLRSLAEVPVLAEQLPPPD